MEQIHQILRNIGLTDTEIKVYLVGLAYQNLGVSEIVKETGVNRTTVYHALDTLMQKGLVAKKNIGAKLVFNMTQPESINNLLEERIKMLEKQKDEVAAIIPLLTQKRQGASSKVLVSHYEGIEGIKLVVEDAFYCRSGHWDLISPLKNFFSEFDSNYAKYFVETRKKRGITSRSLWESAPTHKFLTQSIIKERNPRILPEIMHGKFQSVICLYDDKVAIISSLKTLSAILIQSEEIHKTLFAIFEGLWHNSTEIK